MTDTATTGQSEKITRFVWRRIEEPLQIGSLDLDSRIWYVLLAAVLLVALFYVVWMYVKDSKGIGLGWASLLGVLRLCVYVLLAWVFLLPAKQQFNKTTTQGKSVVLMDVSDSLHTSDDIPTGRSGEKLRTRMDQVRSFLTDPKVDFFGGLEKKNPLTAHRFGTKLDPEYIFFSGGMVWTREEKEKPAKDEEGNIILPEKKPLPEDYLRAWLSPRGAFKDGIGLDDKEQRRLEKLHLANAKAAKEGLTRGTNIGESLLALVNKELNSRLQGIVVFTDGRNTEGSNSVFRELETRAKAARIPIFVVGVGHDRQKVKIDITELRLPETIQPDDKFRAVTDITGEGLAGQKLDVTLEIVHVRTVKTKVKNKEGKIVEEEKEEVLPIEVIEAENENDPKAKRIKVPLGTKLELKPADATLDKSNPPRVEVEWQLDAVALAAAAKIDLTGGDYKGKKWEIAETKEDSELKFRIRVPTDPREGLGAKKFHESDRSPLKVIKKPLRVLLMAAGANRDYQFVRTLMVREAEKKKLELAIYLQLPPGEIKRRPGVVQDVPPERLLATFPDTLGKKKADLYDLDAYDVIVGFDPDWNQLTIDQVANLKRWCEKGGGMVLIGGHINTVELVKPREGADAERYKPILDILPVILDDRRDFTERKTDDPWALDFESATPEMEFLKLDEELDETKFKEDWRAFFYGLGKERTDKPQRGFYNFYPVLKAKPGALIVARFTDPGVRLKDGTFHPYLVMNPDQLARVIWIGSAETWRLREYREEYHERFWTKLVRYAGSRSKGGTQAIKIEMSRVYTANRYVDVDARIDGPDGNPLDRSAKPEIRLQMPPGVPDNEVKQPIVMSPRPGARDGWFSGKFQVRSPGEYELTVKVPKQPGMDTEMVETRKFTVKESNPELDNTRPDFLRMYRLASEADDVLLRMNDGDRNELKRRLQRPKMEEAADKEDRSEMREDKLRLYFDLGNASLIPSCMVQDIQTQTSLGEQTDMWNEDFVDLMYRLGMYRNREGKAEPPTRADRPYSDKKISWVLIAVVLLLSTEWLIRKLLRLA